MDVPEVNFSVNLLLFPLVGGYFIVTRSEPFRYLNQRLGSQAVLFNSIIAGIPLLLISLFATGTVSYIWADKVEYVKTNYFPIKDQYFGTCALSFVLALFISSVLNWTTSKSNAIKKAIKKVGNELELLFSYSATESEPIQISLRNDKVYIGWVTILPQPSRSPYVRIIPLFSGYRNSQKELILTTDYSRVYADYISKGMIRDIADLDVNVVILTSEIISAGRFEFEIFEKFERIAAETKTNS